MKKLLFTLLFLAGLIAQAQAATRYVDANLGANCSGNYSIASRNCSGADGDAYTAANVNTAINAGSAGDITEVRSGTYTTAFAITAMGSSWSSPRAIRCRSGETCTVQVSGDMNAFVTGGAGSYFTIISGFIFDGTNLNQEQQQIGIGGSGVAVNFVRIQGNTFINNARAHAIFIFHGTIGNEVLNNVIHGGGFDCTGGVGGSFCYGMYISGSSALIEGNELYDLPSYGIHVYSGHPERPTNTVVRRNYVHGAGTSVASSAGILLGNSVDNQAYQNVTVNNAGYGMAVGNGSTGAAVFNNTAYGNAQQGMELGNQSATTLANNIVYNNSAGSFFVWGTAPNFITNLEVDPQFVNAAGGDFRILPTSPAINAGTPVGLPFNGTAPDIGARESFRIASATTINSSNVDVTLQSALSPYTPTTGTTGWTLREGGVTRTLTGGLAQNATTYRLTCAACLSAGTTITVSLAADTLTDSIGATLGGQKNFTETNFPVTNTLSGGKTPTVAVEKYRVRRWGAMITANTDADWLSSLNQACSSSACFGARNDGARIGIAWQITANGGTPTVTGYSTEFCAVDTNPCTPDTDVTDTCAVNPLCYDSTDSGQTHGTLISATRFNNPEPNFVAGGVVAMAGGYPQPPLVDNSATEIQGMFGVRGGLADGTLVCVRPKPQSGSLTHTVTSCFKIAPPSGGSGA